MPSPASAASSASAEQLSSTAPVAIREIGRGESLKPFIDLTWKINARDPVWIAPLRMIFKQVLDRGKHPFHQHADVAYFLAERGGEAVGRIAAVVNHRANEFHGDRTGYFGVFECIDDAAVAAQLLERAAEWLKARGMETMRGPFNFSTNDELFSPGVLVDGFDTPPVFMMGHNPRYYGGLMEAAGMVKAKDLVAMWLGNPNAPPRLVQGMEKLAKREGWKIRSADMKRLKEEVATVMEVYNAAWERNWGFIPMTHAEFESMAKEFKPVVDPELVLIAETTEGEPIGFALVMPDLNQAFRHLPNGRLFPFGVFKFLWHRRKIRTMRFLTLGLKPGWQSSGIGAALYYRVFQVGKAKGYTGCEAGWMLEDNDRMLNGLEKVGFKVYKTYRVYERSL
jgi:GNAT superfamily N-acetyltransferase